MTGDCEVVADFERMEKYVISITSNNTGYGTVDQSVIDYAGWSHIELDENMLDIWLPDDEDTPSFTVTASPVSSTAQYTYIFSGWSGDCLNGEEFITGDCEIVANFDRIVNEYTVEWIDIDGTEL